MGWSHAVGPLCNDVDFLFKRQPFGRLVIKHEIHNSLLQHVCTVRNNLLQVTHENVFDLDVLGRVPYFPVIIAGKKVYESSQIRMSVPRNVSPVVTMCTTECVTRSVTGYICIPYMVYFS